MANPLKILTDLQVSGSVGVSQGNELKIGSMEVSSSISSLQSDVSTAQSDISGLQSDVSTAQSDISGLQSDVSTAQSDISGLQSDVSTAQSDISGLQSDVSGLQSDVSTAQSDISGLQSDVSTAQSDISGLQSDVSTAQSDISGLQSDVSTAQSDISGLQSDVSTAQSDISGLQSDVSTAQSDISGLQSDVSTAQSDISGLQSDVSTAQSDISGLQSDVSTAQSDISGLQSDVSTAQSDISGLQSDVSTLQSDVSTAQSDISGLQSDVSTAQSDISALESDVSTLQAATASYVTKDQNGNVAINGNLSVSGYVTGSVVRIDTTNVVVEDQYVYLNSGSTGITTGEGGVKVGVSGSGGLYEGQISYVSGSGWKVFEGGVTGAESNSSLTQLADLTAKNLKFSSSSGINGEAPGIYSVEDTFKSLVNNSVGKGDYYSLRSQGVGLLKTSHNGVLEFHLSGGNNINQPYYTQNENVVTCLSITQLSYGQDKDSCLNNIALATFDVATKDSGSDFWTNDLVSVKVEAVSGAEGFYPKFTVSAPALNTSNGEDTAQVRLIVVNEGSQVINQGGGVKNVLYWRVESASTVTGTLLLGLSTNAVSDNFATYDWNWLTTNGQFMNLGNDAYSGSVELEIPGGYIHISSSVGGDSGYTSQFSEGENARLVWSNTGSVITKPY